MDIKIRTIGPDEFKCGILSGEIPPHDVEIILKYKNGENKCKTVTWDEIVTFFKYHDLSAVDETYQHLTGYHGWA